MKDKSYLALESKIDMYFLRNPPRPTAQQCKAPVRVTRALAVDAAFTRKLCLMSATHDLKTLAGHHPFQLPRCGFLDLGITRPKDAIKQKISVSG